MFCVSEWALVGYDPETVTSWLNALQIWLKMRLLTVVTYLVSTYGPFGIQSLNWDTSIEKEQRMFVDVSHVAKINHVCIKPCG